MGYILYVKQRIKKMYIFKTKPFKHQQDIFDGSWDRIYYALFMEMGLGKS